MNTDREKGLDKMRKYATVEEKCGYSPWVIGVCVGIREAVPEHPELADVDAEAFAAALFAMDYLPFRPDAEDMAKAIKIMRPGFPKWTQATETSTQRRKHPA